MSKDYSHWLVVTAILLVLSIGVGCAFEAEDTGSENNIAKTQAPVQWDYMYESGSILRRAKIFHNMTSGTNRKWIGQSTGNIIIQDEYYSSGANVKTSCGATFISPHYAVTAAHCVDGSTDQHPVVDQDRIIFVVEYAVGPNLPNLENQAGVDWTYPDHLWPSWTRQGALDGSDDYSISRVNFCKVWLRCDQYDLDYADGTGFGPGICNGTNCPCANTGVDGVDIALLHCINDRPASAIVNGETVPTYVTVSSSNQYAGGVNVYWFHEVLDLPTSDTGAANWSRYGGYEEDDYPNNFHYAYSMGDHQRLPIVSDTFYKQSDGTTHNYKVTQWGAMYSESNIFACHGTSGSGIFETGMTFLLGPADHGRINFHYRDIDHQNEPSLCAIMNLYEFGTGDPSATIAFPSAEITRLLADRCEVQIDIQGYCN